MRRNSLVRQLLYKSKNRGCRENDFILGNFAEKSLPLMTVTELMNYARFLEENDLDIYNWLTQKVPLPSHLDSTVFQQLLNFIDNSEK